MPLLGIAILVIASVSLVTYSVLAAKTSQREMVHRRLKENKANLSAATVQETSAGKWFKEKAAPMLAKPVKPKSVSEQNTLRVKLANAGFRRDATPVVFLASKSIIGVGLGVLALAGTIGAGSELQRILGITIFAAGMGFMLPDIWLMLARSARAEKLNHGLPDCLDLLVVSVEAGLGLDAAIQRVSQEMGKVHAEIAEEFTLTNREVQMGITRAEALTNFAIRAGVPEVKSLSAILIQAEKFGTSIAAALRIHADTLRIKRRQLAEERAAKTAVKLILPLILFIFPAIFVVLAGPAVLKLWEVFTSGALGNI